MLDLEPEEWKKKGYDSESSDYSGGGENLEHDEGYFENEEDIQGEYLSKENEPENKSNKEQQQQNGRDEISQATDTHPNTVLWQEKDRNCIEKLI